MLVSADADVVVTNDGATIVDKMVFNKIIFIIFLGIRTPNC